MSLLTVTSPVICSRVEFAFGADLTAPAESWTWTEMADYTAEGRTRPRLLNQTLEVSSGRRNESHLADPSQIELVLGNGDGALTPRNPSSAYYPGAVRGTPCRVSVQAGDPHLLLRGVTGSRARTPDAAALDVTGDLAGIVEFLSPVTVPPQGTTYTIAGKYVTSGNQRSWLLMISSNGKAILRWSNDGTTITDKTTSLPLAIPEAGKFTLGFEFDVSNGGNNIATWYARRSDLADLRANLSASQFGDPDTDSGTTTIFASTSPLDIGDIGSGFTPYPGRINRVQIRSGNLTTGTVVADLDATQLTPGATGTTDTAGRVWTFSNADVTNWRPRFCGRVIGTEAGWDIVNDDDPLAPTIAHVKIQAAGILERLNQADALESALTRFLSARVNNPDLVACWPFEDGRDSSQAAQLVTGADPMSIRGDFTFGGDTEFASSLQQLTIGSGQNAYMSAAIPHIDQVTGVNWQVTRFIRIDEPTTDSPGTQIMAVDTNGEVHTWRININNAQMTVTGLDIDGVGVVLSTRASDTEWFGNEIMVVLEVTDDGANVDWAASIITLPFGQLYQVSGTFVGNTGIPSRFRNSCTGPPSGIALGHLIVTQNKPIGWLAPADTAYANEPAASRVFRLCQELRIPIAVNGAHGVGSGWQAAVLAGAQSMGPQRPAKLLDLLDECAEVDQGVLTEQRGSLGLSYRSGSDFRNQLTRLTLSRANRELIEPFGPTDDDLRTVNDVTVTRPDGSSAHILDPRIEAGDEERYEESTEVNVASDFQLPSQAGWRYHLGTWSELRYPEIATDIAKSAGIVEDALGLGVGDRFQVPDPPPGHPPDTIDQLADGITEQLERFQWRFTFNGHPARPWDTALLEDDELGRLDTAGSELAAPFTVGTQTTMSVATTLGPLWTTTGGEFPFDVEVAGARVTVTGISGASSPQTFTVTQAAVNGVAKVIPAGTAVRLWQPALLSL